MHTARSQNGSLDLYLVNASGGTPRLLASGPGRQFNPAWLPDGDHLIYVSDESGVQRLNLLTISLGLSQPLLNLPAPTGWPAVAPDGSQLAFSAAPGGNWDLYLVNFGADGKVDLTSLIILTEDSAEDITPAWSPDSQWLAFASDRSGSLDLFLLDLKDKSISNLTSAAGNEWAPAWLKSGQILFQHYDGQRMGLWLLDPQSGDLTQPLLNQGYAVWPAVQP